MAEEGQQQQAPQTTPAVPPQTSPPEKPVPRRRATDVAPANIDPSKLTEAMRPLFEEFFGKKTPEEKPTTEQKPEEKKTETPPKRRGSWFWGR